MSEHRRQIVQRELARLITIKDTNENAAQSTRAANFFDAEMVQIDGAPYPISRALALQMGYDISSLPHGYDAGDDDARSD